MTSARCHTGASFRGMPVGCTDASVSGALFLHSMGSFCLLAFGAFLPFQRYKATHRQGTQTVLGAFMILFPEHRPHADGKLIDLNAAELCHCKMPEFMDGDHRAEHEQRSKDGDNK